MPQRLAVFSLVEWSFATVRDWAASAGHEIALLVTQPSSPSAPGLHYSTLGSQETVVMVVPTVTACKAALIDLDVDLGIVFTFRRVPESVATLPHRGCVNLHPSLLPAYRGANGYRALYEGEPQIGATLHHLTPKFDEGPILAQSSYATPEDVEPSTALETLQRAATDVLEIGVPRVLAGEPGQEQNSSVATTAPKFTEDEAVLQFAVTTHLFRCRMSALILAGIQPWVTLESERQPLRAVRPLPGLMAQSPGVISTTARQAIVATLDGALELEIGKLPF